MNIRRKMYVRTLKESPCTVCSLSIDVVKLQYE